MSSSMSVKLFFLRYNSWRFKQFSKSANVLIRLTLNASTSTPRMRRMMETSLSSLPQQLSFLIAPKSDCLDRAMTISSVRRAMVLSDHSSSFSVSASKSIPHHFVVVVDSSPFYCLGLAYYCVLLPTNPTFASAGLSPLFTAALSHIDLKLGIDYRNYISSPVMVYLCTSFTIHFIYLALFSSIGIKFFLVDFLLLCLFSDSNQSNFPSFTLLSSSKVALSIRRIPLFRHTLGIFPFLLFFF